MLSSTEIFAHTNEDRSAVASGCVRPAIGDPRAYACVRTSSWAPLIGASSICDTR